MNKLFTKVATLCVGLAMAAGVGVAVGASSVSEAKAADSEYIKVSSLSAGKEVLIVSHCTSGTNNGQYYVVDAVTQATSTGPSAIKVSAPENDKISGNLDANLFTVAASSTSWTFQTGTKFLVLGAPTNNNGARINTDTQNRAWAYSNGILSNPGTGTTRYFGVYNDSQWRTYNTSNAGNYDGSGENVEFYEKVQSTTPNVSLDNPSLSELPFGYAVNSNLKATASNFAGNVTFTWSATVNGEYVTVTPDGQDSSKCVIASKSTNTGSSNVVVTIKVEATDGSSTESDTVNISIVPVKTVAEARTAASTTSVKTYVSGKIYNVASFNSTYGSITYWISEDGTGNVSNKDGVQIYGGLGLYGAQFESLDDLAAGDEVVVYGDLKDYNGTKELDKNNILVSYVANPDTPEIPEPSMVVGKKLSDLFADESGNWKQLYEVTGIVSAWKDDKATDGTQYGNFYLKDSASDEEQYYIYGATANASKLTWSTTSGVYSFSNPSDFLTNEVTKDIVIGSVLTMRLSRCDYNETKEASGIVVSVEPATIEYTISYNANGGTGEMASTVGESPAVAACTFTRDGYTFTGWNSAADGSGESYEVAQVVSKDVELFAQWEAESPAVTDWSQAFKDKYYEVFGEGKEVILPPFLTADYANDEVITWYDGQGLPLCDIDLVDDELGTNFSIIDTAIDESSNWTYFGPSSNYPANQGFIYVANDYSAFAVTYIYMNDQNEVHSGVSFETILSIALESDSAKKNYYVGDNLDTTGLVVHYALADGDWNSNFEITSWTASPSVFTEAGEQDVTVSVTLQGKVYSLKYAVNVEEFVPASLALSGEYKTVFEYKEEFSHEGLVVTATMGDETTRDVSSIAEFSGYDSNVAGEQTITVEVAGVTTTYTVTVKEYVPVLKGIQVTKNPAKVEYEIGEAFDSSGIEVSAIYDVGDPKVVDLKDVSFSGFDSATAGEKTVTVSYGNFSTTIKVTVKKAAYTAEQFAEEFLAEIEKVCKGYDGKKNNKNALNNVWTKMSARYNELSSEEKTKIANATPKADGDAIQRMLTFYNYACKKYGLTKFISTQKSSLVISSTETTNNNLPIIVIVASAIAAVTAIGVVIGLKRRKNLLVK